MPYSDRTRFRIDATADVGNVQILVGLVSKYIVKVS